MSTKVSPISIKISSFISTLFHPIISLTLFFIYFSNTNGLSFEDDIRHFSFILGIIILPIVFWISWKVKTKQYTNTDVSNRKQRKSLYFFIESMQSVYLLIYYLITKEIDLMILFLLILTLLMQWSNYFVKSSMHVAFNVYVGFLYFSIEPILGYIWGIITCIVAFTRIILKRHTVKEIIWGTIISFLVSFTYLYASMIIQLKN